MQSGGSRRCGLRAAALAVVLVSILAGCGARIGGPAPLVSGEAASGPTSPPGRIVVQHGQTLSGIAQAYHLPLQSIAEANHLSPPYRIVAGSALIIPGGGEPAVASPPVSVAALPPAGPEAIPPAAAVSVPAATVKPPPIAAAPLPTPAKPPPAAASSAPSEAETSAPPAAAPAPALATQATVAPPPAASAALTPPPPVSAPPQHGGSGAFLWPVRGRVLEGYGSGANGTHNDGINIAAPRGAAVQAADAGIVAYAGNELRGYGNLVLVKHQNGWISAYAHCDLILVKKGEKVARGQVIARVGATGNVSEPQLHFELRRGNKPVDPQEFLAQPPTADRNKGPHAS